MALSYDVTVAVNILPRCPRLIALPVRSFGILDRRVDDDVESEGHRDVVRVRICTYAVPMSKDTMVFLVTQANQLFEHESLRTSVETRLRAREPDA